MQLMAVTALCTLAVGFVALRRATPSRYRTTPVEIQGMPSGIPYIIGNEGAERFSFYGMKAILVVFMTQHLVGPAGVLAPMTEAEAKSWYHLFTAAVYFTPVLGAFLADWLFGKYRVIMALSIVYCLGHLALALDETRAGLLAGLSLIALGAGGIKPLVTAHVADQFGKTNEKRLTNAISWFYWSVNAGALVSILLTPWLLQRHGPQVAFAVPGVLMLAATILFWIGRYCFVHMPPAGQDFLRVVRSEGPAVVRRLLPVLVLAVVFFALFDQQGSALVLQAQKMDNHILGIELLPSQIQSANPFLILALLPLFSGVVYPAVAKVVNVTELGKACVGCLLMVACFLLLAHVQTRIDAGEQPNVVYHLLAYVLLTAAEVLVSVTLIEYTCRRAKRLRSLAVAAFLLSVSAGNLLTAGINAAISQLNGTSWLEGANYFRFFAGLIAITAVGFGYLAYRKFDAEPPAETKELGVAA